MFERIICVDWSAASAPKTGRDSIWTYCTDDFLPVNHRTRAASYTALVEQLCRPGRTLIGFDFPFGYTAGFARCAGLTGNAPWAAAWQFLAASVSDDEHNRNNRWTVAADLNRRIGRHWFWGVPPKHESEHLHRHKSAQPDELRLVERHLREQGMYPFAARHLLGAGSVGSQALLGIPVVRKLRHHPDLVSRSRIWPFETGLTADPVGGDGDAIVMAETWPSAIGFDHVDHVIKDARQVVALAHHYAALDRRGELAGCFQPHLDDRDARRVVEEEAWILGVG